MEEHLILSVEILYINQLNKRGKTISIDDCEFILNRLRPLFLHPNQQNPKNDQGPFIENCIGISPRN